MSDARSMKPGGISGRKLVRTVIWAGLAAYGLYLSAAAFAEPAKAMDSDLQPAASLLGLNELGKLPVLGNLPGLGMGLGGGLGMGLIEREKAMIFERSTPGDPREEIACLALNIYFEARSEPDQGKFAVSHVVMNRVASGRFPDTICEVIQQGGSVRLHRCQFSWWCDGQSDEPRSRRAWELSNEIALTVYWGRSADPTGGALWYHADYVSPAWRHDFEAGPKIGRHFFYRTADAGTRVASQQVSSN